MHCRSDGGRKSRAATHTHLLHHLLHIGHVRHASSTATTHTHLLHHLLYFSHVRFAVGTHNLVQHAGWDHLLKGFHVHTRRHLRHSTSTSTSHRIAHGLLLLWCLAFACRSSFRCNRSLLPSLVEDRVRADLKVFLRAGKHRLEHLAERSLHEINSLIHNIFKSALTNK